LGGVLLRPEKTKDISSTNGKYGTIPAKKAKTILLKPFPFFVKILTVVHHIFTSSFNWKSGIQHGQQ
jgi:hypothetical protein